MSDATVLIVDDDPVFVASISVVLETRYVVRTASNGPEALAAVEESKPDLIILDVMMDYLSEGFDVARVLRTNTDTRGIPIIMLTGVDQVFNYRMEVDESWVPSDRYMEKPVTPDTLLKNVEDLLAGSAS